MDPLERFIRVVCIIGIVILSVYIGIMLLPGVPETMEDQIRQKAGQVTEHAIGEMTLLTKYICSPPKLSYGFRDLVVKLLDAPLGLYVYLADEKGNEENVAFHDKENMEDFPEKNSGESQTSVQEPGGQSTEETQNLQESGGQSTEESQSLQESAEQNTDTQSLAESGGANDAEQESGQELLPDSSQPTATYTVNNPDPAAPVSVLIPSGSSVISKITALSQTGTISLDQMLSYEYLMENLYKLNPACSITEEILNPSVLLSKDLSVAKTTDGPQILIYHTHSQEAYIDSTPGDVSQTIVGVGDYLSSILTNQYGYSVLHDTGTYDMENGKLDRSQAYNRALPALTEILAQYPTIQVVIDLHRDGVADNVHLVTDVNGKPTARIMLFNGICRDTQGDLPDLVNPYREDNLAFSLQLGLYMKNAYPNVLRMVYFKKSRYNQHLASRSILVEVGAQTNTVAEGMNAMEVLAEILNDVLS